MSDSKGTDAAGVSSGITGGIMGAIRRTSGAFANTLHQVVGTGQPDQANAAPKIPSNEPSTGQQGGERRMSDIEHLWQTSRQMHGF
ncbi:hypothetical protein RB195_017617 [Necator americanus]|uniref:Uncharacterized protein n=1 Tax=Necator americanus TaxID=51031 RepID=A0ABR1C848_NECAM